MTLPAIDSMVRKIISSRAMARSERLARFLEFTVKETMAGNAGQIKEFVLGVEVFGRTPDYDPRLDPIVRVEARRLRMKLRKYYDTEGRDDRIRIEYPKGSYVPAISPFRPEDRTAAHSGEPRRAIVVLPFAGMGESEPVAAAVGQGLISALIQMEDLRVVAWNMSLRLQPTPRDYARLGDQLQVEGVVEGRVAPVRDDRIRVAAQLVDVRDGAYLWAESFERPRGEISFIRDSIAAGLARALHLNSAAAQA
jgi:serine/threonine-protein kinase